MSTHPFDSALQLRPDFGGQPDQFLGRSSPAWWNMVGPFGGVSAAVALNAILSHPARLAESGTGYLLGQARGQAFRNGFFDQAGLLWSAAGTLLATTHQLVCYKE